MARKTSEEVVIIGKELDDIIKSLKEAVKLFDSLKTIEGLSNLSDLMKKLKMESADVKDIMQTLTEATQKLIETEMDSGRTDEEKLDLLEQQVSQIKEILDATQTRIKAEMTGLHQAVKALNERLDAERAITEEKKKQSEIETKVEKVKPEKPKRKEKKVDTKKESEEIKQVTQELEKQEEILDKKLTKEQLIEELQKKRVQTVREQYDARKAGFDTTQVEGFENLSEIYNRLITKPQTLKNKTKDAIQDMLNIVETYRSKLEELLKTQHKIEEQSPKIADKKPIPTEEVKKPEVAQSEVDENVKITEEKKKQSDTSRQEAQERKAILKIEEEIAKLIAQADRVGIREPDIVKLEEYKKTLYEMLKADEMSLDVYRQLAQLKATQLEAIKTQIDLVKQGRLEEQADTEGLKLEREKQKTEEFREQAKQQELINKLKTEFSGLTDQAERLGMPQESIDIIKEYYEISRQIIEDENQSGVAYDRKIAQQTILKNEIKEQIKERQEDLKLQERISQQSDIQAKRIGTIGDNLSDKFNDMIGFLDQIDVKKLAEEYSEVGLIVEKNKDVIQEISDIAQNQEALESGKIGSLKEINEIVEETKDKQKLVSDTIDKQKDTLYTIFKLEKERQDVVDKMQQTGFDKSDINKADQEYRKLIESATRFTGEQQKAEISIVRSSKEFQQINANVKKANQVFSNTSEHIANISRRSQGFNQILRDAFQNAFSIEKVANRIAFVITAKLSYDAFKYFHRGIREGIKLAIQFEETMARVYALLGEADTPALRTQFADAARTSMIRYAQSIETTNRALYDIISAQIDASKATEVLNATMRLAVAEFTDVKIATDAVTTTLNAYSMSAEKAADVSDLLSVIITQGKTTLEDLAPVWGRVAAVGGMFDIRIEDLAASLAVMTQQGLSAGEATTSLRQLLLTILQPTEKSKEVMEKYGLEIDAVTLRTKGLAHVAEQLIGLREEDIVTLASSRRGIMALAAASSDAERYQRTYEAMLNRSGETQRKFAEMSETAAFRAERMKSEFADMSLTMGQSVLPILEEGFEGLRNFAAGANALIQVITELRLQYVILAAVVAKLTPMMLANPYLAVAAALGVAIGLIGTYLNSQKELIELTREIREERTNEMKTEIEQLSQRREALFRLIELERQTERNAQAEAEYTAIKEALGEEFKNTTDAIADANREIAKIDLEKAILVYQLFKKEVTDAKVEIGDFRRELIKFWSGDIPKITRELRKYEWGYHLRLIPEVEEDAQLAIQALENYKNGIGETEDTIEALQTLYEELWQAATDYPEEVIKGLRNLDSKEKARIDTARQSLVIVGDTIKSFENLLGLQRESEKLADQQRLAFASVYQVINELSEGEVSLDFDISELTKSIKDATLEISLDEDKIAETISIVEEFNEEFGKQEDIQERITKARQGDEEAIKSLIALMIELITKTDEQREAEERRRAVTLKEWEKRLQDIRDNIQAEKIWLGLVEKEDEEIRKLTRSYQEMVKELDELEKQRILPEGFYDKIIKDAQYLLKLQKDRLIALREYNKAQRETSQLLERQRIVEQARELGWEVKIEMPSVDEIENQYDKLIAAAKDAQEDTVSIEWEKRQALDRAYLNQLNDLDRHIEERRRLDERQQRQERIQRQAGLADLKRMFGEEFAITSLSITQLEQLLQSKYLTAEARIVIQTEIDQRDIQTLRNNIDIMMQQFEDRVAMRTLKSPIPTMFTDMFTAPERRKEMEAAMNELLDAGDTEGAMKYQTMIVQEELQARVQAEQYIAGQLTDIWNMYLQNRQAQIQAEYDANVKALQKRHQLEFRSQIWLDTEMEKLNEKKAKEERKLKKQQQRMQFMEASMNIATAITKALAGLQWWAIPIISALGAIQLSMIASQKFASGGYTGRSGRAKRDETGERPAGIVHEEEFVFSKQATRGNIGLLYTIHDMLSGKSSSHKPIKPRTHFAEGGYTGKGRALQPNIQLGLDSVEDKLDDLIKAAKEDKVFIKTKTITPLEVSRLADRGRAEREMKSI